jgi:hypothetical protein
MTHHDERAYSLGQQRSIVSSGIVLGFGLLLMMVVLYWAFDGTAERALLRPVLLWVGACLAISVPIFGFLVKRLSSPAGAATSWAASIARSAATFLLSGGVALAAGWFTGSAVVTVATYLGVLFLIRPAMERQHATNQ